MTRLTLATLLTVCLAAVAEVTSGVDLFIRDSPTDAGSQPSPVPHWTSPDIWVRNDASAADDPELGHQPPINGQPNYLYVRVHHRGTAPVAAGAARVAMHRCDPGTGMVWPTDFTPVGELVVTDPIAAGGSVRVGPFTWTPRSSTTSASWRSRARPATRPSRTSTRTTSTTDCSCASTTPSGSATSHRS